MYSNKLCAEASEGGMLGPKYQGVQYGGIDSAMMEFFHVDSWPSIVDYCQQLGTVALCMAIYQYMAHTTWLVAIMFGHGCHITS